MVEHMVAINTCQIYLYSVCMVYLLSPPINHLLRAHNQMYQMKCLHVEPLKTVKRYANMSLSSQNNPPVIALIICTNGWQVSWSIPKLWLEVQRVSQPCCPRTACHLCGAHGLGCFWPRCWKCSSKCCPEEVCILFHAIRFTV